jgi:hypothetical protein
VYTYAVHGLTIAVPFRCPELVSSDGVPDVSVLVGPIHPPASVWPSYAGSPDQLVLALVDVGRFLVRQGREVTMEPLPGVDADALRPYLLGSCLAAVLQQRGVLPLHASAVQSARGAIVILGGAGAGKSSLAAAFVRSGLSLIADDLCAIVPDSDGWPVVLPGPRRLKLREDAVERLGIDGGQAEPLVDGRRKFSVPVPPQRSAPAGARVQAMYVLLPSEGVDMRIEALEGGDRVAALTGQTFRSQFLDWLSRRGDHFHQVVAAARAPVFLVRRPENPALIEQLAQDILFQSA